jgi:GTP-binding protein EngB required for normal cell division
MNADNTLTNLIIIPQTLLMTTRPCKVAFLGRSNVGKSSLVAALLKDAAGGTGRGLVRTSKTPGALGDVVIGSGRVDLIVP